MLATTVKLLLASLAVGLVLSALDITPNEVFDRVARMVGYAVENAGDLAGWAFGYIILGAIVVVPVWLLIALFQRFRRR